MREIKFRAWNKDSKYIYYPTEGTPEPLTIDYQFAFWKNAWELEGLTAEGQQVICGDYDDISGKLSNGVLMEYAGRKDKDGADIYECDILRTNRGVVTVEFEDSQFVCYSKGHFYQGRLSELNHISVIGNIYQDKGLLK